MGYDGSGGDESPGSFQIHLKRNQQSFPTQNKWADLLCGDEWVWIQ